MRALILVGAQNKLGFFAINFVFLLHCSFSVFFHLTLPTAQLTLLCFTYHILLFWSFLSLLCAEITCCVLIKYGHIFTPFLFYLFHVPPLFFPLLSPLPLSFLQVVSQRFPQNSIGAVGSAMFLRFVNPAIVSPYEAGILEKKPLPRIERGLKLMSKVKLLWVFIIWLTLSWSVVS